jgi:hypothetical protein
MPIPAYSNANSITPINSGRLTSMAAALLGSAAARAGGWMLEAVVVGADAGDEGT